MGKMQRSKGRRGELEAAAEFREAGFEADLIRGQEEDGGGRGDLDTSIGLVEVKRRAGLAKCLEPPEGVVMVVARRDRGKWLAIEYLVDVLNRELEVRGLRHQNELLIGERDELIVAARKVAELHQQRRDELDVAMPRSTKCAPCGCEICTVVGARYREGR